MRNRVIVSERGTVTIPGSVRKAVHIRPGDLVEFHPLDKNKIILKHLVATAPEEESFMDYNEWDKFDKLVQGQLKEKQYTGYSDLKKAKAHSRKLMGKK